MKRFFCVMLCSAIVGASAHDKLNVVTTTPDLAAIARAIGGAEVEVISLTKPTEDPHFVTPKPSLVLKLNRADALIEGGAELEAGWLTPLLDAARNPKLGIGAPGRIQAARAVALIEVPTGLDRSHGDVHAMGNPHFMTDPLNARAVAELVAARFATLAPEKAETFKTNLARFTTQLESKLAEWEKLLAPFAGRRVVAYHNTWPYFARRFNLRIDLFLEPKPGIPPTPAHLTEVIARMRAEKVRVVLVEPYQNRKTAERIAAETGAVLVEFCQFPGGVKGAGPSYFEWMDYLVRALSDALAKTAEQ
ncbi:MAG: metal ABC transporter substrate-binding protein [Verrucomicrobiae bacterium]|nr:metal ABC transporter substrate-binding protein [Verrucomicrobiae bacterium]